MVDFMKLEARRAAFHLLSPNPAIRLWFNAAGCDVGGADGGVEAGVGFAERVGAGFFEGAVEGAQGVAELRHLLAAQGAQRHGGGGHFRDLPLRRRLRPREGVEDGFGE